VSATADAKPIYQLQVSAQTGERMAQFYLPTQIGDALLMPKSLSIEVASSVVGKLDLFIAGLDQYGAGVAFGDTSLELAGGKDQNAAAVLSTRNQRLLSRSDMPRRKLPRRLLRAAARLLNAGPERLWSTTSATSASGPLHDAEGYGAPSSAANLRRDREYLHLPHRSVVQGEL
jgi:hypothetical protein